MFSIVSTIAYAQLGDLEEGSSVLSEIGIVILEFIVGTIIGVLAGLLGKGFKFFKKSKTVMRVKALWCLFWALAFMLASNLSGFPFAKFTASLSFGYVSYRIWGEEKPIDELALFWLIFQPV
jgi:hypothetical protein